MNDANIAALKEAGVDVCVAGSYVFKHPEGLKPAIDSLKV